MSENWSFWAIMRRYLRDDSLRLVVLIELRLVSDR